MKLIGKLDGLPLFEIEEGKYIAVNPDTETCKVLWSWLAVLGRWYDTFEKCEECEDEVACLHLIEQNKEELAEHLTTIEKEKESDDFQEWMEKQQEFYDWLDSNREYDFTEGYVDEEEDED